MRRLAPRSRIRRKATLKDQADGSPQHVVFAGDYPGVVFVNLNRLGDKCGKPGGVDIPAVATTTRSGFPGFEHCREGLGRRIDHARLMMRLTVFALVIKGRPVLLAETKAAESKETLTLDCNSSTLLWLWEATRVGGPSRVFVTLAKFSGGDVLGTVAITLSVQPLPPNPTP